VCQEEGWRYLRHVTLQLSWKQCPNVFSVRAAPAFMQNEGWEYSSLPPPPSKMGGQETRNNGVLRRDTSRISGVQDQGEREGVLGDIPQNG